MARDGSDLKDLPDSTQPRILALVERSSPNIDKPKLPPDVEYRLDPIERKTAACYAEAEEATFRLNKLARKLAARPKRGIAR